METQNPLIYKAIMGVMADIGVVGKNQTNSFQHYQYRGIDDLYNAFHPLFIKHGIFIATEVLESRTGETTSRNAEVQHRVYLRVAHHFSAVDGSLVTVTTSGEGMDSSDKASNKAMSAAMKYALVQTFCIPTAGAEDSDASSPGHTANAVPTRAAPQQQATASRPAPATPRQQPTTNGAKEISEAGVRENVYVDNVWVKDDPNGKWSRASIDLSDGSKCNTFDKKFIEIASAAAENKTPVTITTVPDPKDAANYQPKVTDIVTLAETGDSQPADVPAPLTPAAAEAMSAVIEEVNSVGVKAVDGKEVEAWIIKTSQGEYGCTDAESVRAANANLGESVIIHSIPAPSGHRLRRIVRVDDSVF